MLQRVSIGTALFESCVAEGEERKIDVINCVLESPVFNSRSSMFVTAKGRKRISTLHDPTGTPLMSQPLVWACRVTWPMRTGGAATG